MSTSFFQEQRLNLVMSFCAEEKCNCENVLQKLPDHLINLRTKTWLTGSSRAFKISFLCIAESLVFYKHLKKVVHILRNCITITYIPNHELNHSYYVEKYWVTNRGFSHFTTKILIINKLVASHSCSHAILLTYIT